MNDSNRKRLLITGVTGFVGGALGRECLADGRYPVIGAVRSPSSRCPAGMTPAVVGDIDGGTDWAPALQDVSVVIHGAARAHRMEDIGQDRLDQYRAVNTEGTLNLARQASAAGVRRFIFISTIKVNGSTTTTTPFRADDSPAPVGDYAISKWEAEQGLWEISEASGMEVVVIRPTLVYGPGVKANFAQLFGWVRRGIPLPLAAIKNRRTFVSIDNLCSLIRTCIDHPGAANQVILASDGESLSVPELIRRMAAALGRPSRLYYFPVAGLRVLAALAGRRESLERLVENLEVDGTEQYARLNWSPPQAMAVTLKNMADSVQSRDS